MTRVVRRTNRTALKGSQPSTERRKRMAKIKMFVRDVSYRIREGKDGPQQYARIVCHAEVPDNGTKDAIDALTDDPKGALIATMDVEQPQLPLLAGMKG